jgi:hypothetical protein
LKRDLKKTIDELLNSAYQQGEADTDYHESFAVEGGRKAQYIIDDLRYREARGQLRTNEMGYLCIGGADGSEVEQVLTDTGIAKAVMIEYGDVAVHWAAPRIERLATRGKQFVVLHGDATARLDTALQTLEAWCTSGEISGLVCSAQAVLHELPTRSPGFDLPIFLGKLFRHPDWQTCAFYSREPCTPAGWPQHVRIRVAHLNGADLARAAQYVRDRLRMVGIPEVLASDWVGLPAMLAVETLHKLIRGSSIRRIGYELGEQLTGFDPLAVKDHLEHYLEEMRVTVDQVTTSGFKKALEDYDVQYVGHNSECLPVPKTHSEIIGIVPLPPQEAPPESDQEPPPQVRDGTPEAADSVAFSNPFGDDVSDAEIRKWLDQFERADRPTIARLLGRFTYIDLSRVRTLSVALHREVQARLGAAVSDSVFVPMGGAAKSGGLIAYFYRRENGLPAERFVDYSSLLRQGGPKAGAVVLLDDLLASGHQAAAEWQKLTHCVPVGSRILLATLVACEAGERYIEERTDLAVCSALRLTRADEPLDPASNVFATEQERTQAAQILSKYGKRLAPSAPLGYAGSGLLLGFAHGTPDNSLPIFWSRAGAWVPLLAAGGSKRIKPGEAVA